MTKKQSNNISSLKFSPLAKDHLLKLIKLNKDQNSFLRIWVTGGGCAGFQYHFDFDNKLKSDDLKIIDGSNMLGAVDESSHNLLINSEVDFVDKASGSYFKINNPNAQGSCGCGSSFSIS